MRPDHSDKGPKTMKVFITPLIGKWIWARQNPLFWANSVLLFVTGAVIWIWPGPIINDVPSDLRIRTWGTILQLIGVLTVWLDLTSTARSFGKGGFFRRTWTWLKGFFCHDVIIGATGAAAGGSTLGARSKQRRSIQPSSPLPARVGALESNFHYLDADLDAAYKEIDMLSRELNAKIGKETRERQEAIRGMEDRLAQAVTANITHLAFGAAWLAIGVVLTSWAPEIAKIAAGQMQAVLEAM